MKVTCWWIFSEIAILGNSKPVRFCAYYEVVGTFRKMSEEYATSLLQISLAQICQNLGFQSASSMSLETLLDLYRRFLSYLAQDLRQFSDHGMISCPVFF